ncbi:RagB/SusD family nutrient uptake outer membrane protein [Draconibacterium sediminis]|uniref:Glycan metabolism protein RagB n=1 Tax=Draconibacterium sediminis TaxID=1544798 RepID=A0A0D8JAL8_9BACT|nr:RagB/SusD family nutrient uptake outer membrane protein [Draconibacterium sediminis]KJF42828.1 glycan metabolism protein RagB [Draconibacterium sediminis]
MKYINNKIVVLLLALSFFATSCDSFLEEDNYTSLSIETAKTDPETFDQLVASVYEISREYTTHYTSDMYYQLEDLGTDIVTRGSLVTGTNDLNDYVNFNSTNWTISVYWTDQYKIISAANIAIDNADEIEGVDANTKATGIGEAKFFRAMSYFNLVENFGGVPLVLNQVTSAETDYVRATEQEVYSQIVMDLEDALAAVPDNPAEYGRVSKDAVRHLLSKVLLTRGYKSFAASTDFTQAASLAETVISNHTLVSSFEDLVSIENQRNSEVVFAYLFGNNPVSRGWGNSRHMKYKFRFYDYPGLSRTVQGLGPMPTPFYFSLFQDDDQRAAATFKRVLYATEEYSATVNGETVYMAIGDTAMYFPKVAWTDAQKAAVAYKVINPDSYIKSDGVTPVHYPLFRKFDDPDVPFTQPDQSSQGERDMVMMRSGEAYLIAAEAYLKQANATKAAELLTDLRSRAGISTAVTTEDATLDFILDERARELAGEVNRWMDLKRTGKLIERTLMHNPHAAFNNALQEKHLLRPIPQTEIDNSGGSITQNPNYS